MFGRFYWVYVNEEIPTTSPGHWTHEFSVQLDGSVKIGVAFDRTPTSQKVVEATRGPKGGTPLDISWAVSEDGRQMLAGEAAESSWSTWGSRDSVGIVFAVFEARANRHYRVDYQTNKSLVELADSRPRLRLSADTSREPFHSRFYAASMLGSLGVLLSVVGGIVAGLWLFLKVKHRITAAAA
jgi:hypothetical protein